MAQHLAEKIVAAEQAEDQEEKQQLESQAVSLILRLWEHRYKIPPHARPFGHLDKAISLLAEVLDNENDTYIHRRETEKQPPIISLMFTAAKFGRDVSAMLALTRFIEELEEDPIAWESEYIDLLEEEERSALYYINQWLRMIDVEGDQEISESYITAGHIKLVISKIKEGLDNLQDCLKNWEKDLPSANVKIDP